MIEIGYPLTVDGVINLLGAKRRLAYSEGGLKIRKFKSYNSLHYFSLYHAGYL
jgi:hypothetical protein